MTVTSTTSDFRHEVEIPIRTRRTGIIRRFLNWFRSLWSKKPAHPMSDFLTYLPTDVIRNTFQKERPAKLSFLQRMAQERRTREIQKHAKQAALARRKTKVVFNENTCVCGCGTKLMVRKGTLQFFVNKAHRRAYRQQHGAIDYALGR